MTNKNLICYVSGLISILAVEASLITVVVLNFPHILKILWVFLIFVPLLTGCAYDYAYRKFMISDDNPS